MDFAHSCQGVAEVIVSVSTPDYTYELLPNDAVIDQNGSVLTISNLCCGSYELTITDDNGCLSTTTINIACLPAPIVELEDVMVCEGDLPVELDAGFGFASYEWSTGATSQTILADAVGTYSVTVTAAGAMSGSSGCAASDQATVSYFDNPIVNLGGELNVCVSDFPTTLDAGSGFASYFWSGGEITQTISVNTAGHYSVTVTDANGCTASDGKDVFATGPPSINLGEDLSLCADETPYTLDAGSGYGTYAWSTGSNSQTISVVSTGTYSVTVTDAGSGSSGGTNCAAHDAINIEVNENPDIELGVDMSICSEATPFVLDAGAGFSAYLWSTGAVVQTINISETGIYSVTVTGANDCTASDSKTVTVTDQLSIDLGEDMDVCADDLPIIIDAGSGFAGYEWSNGEETQSIIVEAPGTYSVVVTDESACTATDSKLITVFDNPTVDLGETTELCPHDLPATIDAGSGFTAYVWSNGETTQSIQSSLAGNYQVTVTDENACTATDAIEMIVYETPAIDLGDDVEICPQNFPLTLEASSGFEHYSWSSGDQTQSISIENEGIYSVTVTDGNGCSNSDSVSVIELGIGEDCPCPNLTGAMVSNSTICSGASIGLDVTVNNPDGGQLMWYDGQGNPVLNPANVVLTTTDCDGTLYEFYAIYSSAIDVCEDAVSETLSVNVLPAITGELTLTEEGGVCMVILSQDCPNYVAGWSDDMGNSGSGFVYTANAGESGLVTFMVANTEGEIGMVCSNSTFEQIFSCCPPPVLTLNASATACDGDVLNLNEIADIPAGLNPVWEDEDGDEVVNPESEMVITSDCNGSVEDYFTQYEFTDPLTGCSQNFQITLAVTIYPTVVASPHFDNENCTISITPSCPNFVVSYMDEMGNSGDGTLYQAPSGASGSVTFMVSNPDVTDAGLDCSMEDFIYNYSCGCPALNNPMASSNEVCSGDAISLSVDVVAMGTEEGSQLNWYNGSDELVEDPDFVVLAGDGCEGTTHEFYAVYVAGTGACDDFTSETIEVTAFPAVTATAEVSGAECIVMASQDCPDYIANWEDNLGNMGSGFTYYAENGTDGEVTFTISNPATLDMSCGMTSISETFDCECPTDVVSASFTHTTCSLTPTDLNEVWGEGAEELTWTNVFGNVIADPSNIIFPANGCQPQTTELSASYVTTDDDGCEVSHLDMVSIVVYPLVSGGTITVSDNGCSVTMIPDCPNYSASWEDDLGNSGNGFDYSANPGEAGEVTFTVANEDALDLDLPCASEEFTADFNCEEIIPCPELSNPTASEESVCSGDAFSLNVTVFNDDGGTLNWFSENGDILGDPSNVLMTTDACEGEQFSFYAQYVPANGSCGEVTSGMVDVFVYPAITTTLDIATDGCSVIATQNCDNFSAVWEDASGNTGNGFDYFAIPGESGTVTFTLTNENIVGALSCATAEFSSLYDCTSCPVLSNPDASEPAICSGDAVELTVEIINGDGGTLSWFDSDDNPVSDPADLVLTTNECAGELFTFYAVYTPANAECAEVTTAPIEVKVYPDIDASLTVAEDGCMVTAAVTCTAYVVSWEDEFGNSGTGLVYQAMPGASGMVTFSFDISGLSSLDCGELQLTATVDCDDCPDDNTSSQSFTNTACSFEPVDLTTVWGTGAETLSWTDSFGNPISDPTNIITPASGCTNHSSVLMTEYTTFDGNGCPVENTDMVTLITVPNTTGGINVSDDGCTVTVSQDCANYTASWTDSFGNSGNGFTYQADSGDAGTVTFTITNTAAGGLDCGTLVLSSAFDCDDCPDDNTSSQSFTNTACSLEPVDLTTVWGPGAETLSWTDTFGNPITDPTNIIFPATGCSNGMSDLMAMYTTLDSNGCPVENTDMVTLITVPNTTGNIGLSENGCTVTVSQDCANYTASWTDSFGNSGSGFVYNADTGVAGSVTFTITNTAAGGLECGTLELSSTFDCDDCPDDNTNSQSFTNTACSLDPVDLTTVWGPWCGDFDLDGSYWQPHYRSDQHYISRYGLC